MRTYFAQLDENNIVTDVHVVTQEFIDANPERYTGVWVQTFFDDPNKIYASIGCTYNFETQNFTQPAALEPEPDEP
jgi:hypothetical protein